MMNAFLDFVGVVNRQLPKKNEHRFISVSVTVYAGKEGGMVSYDTFNICCVLPPGDRWKRVEPRTGSLNKINKTCRGLICGDSNKGQNTITQFHTLFL